MDLLCVCEKGTSYLDNKSQISPVLNGYRHSDNFGNPRLSDYSCKRAMVCMWPPKSDR